jgi:hypothetical protein
MKSKPFTRQTFPLMILSIVKVLTDSDGDFDVTKVAAMLFLIGGVVQHGDEAELTEVLMGWCKKKYPGKYDRAERHVDELLRKAGWK